eukprot:scaffold300_cov20-Tisochrysis_lutea.AAC.5
MRQRDYAYGLRAAASHAAHRAHLRFSRNFLLHKCGHVLREQVRGASLSSSLLSCLITTFAVPSYAVSPQYVSSTPATRLDVINLQEKLDQQLQQRQAREPCQTQLQTRCSAVIALISKLQKTSCFAAGLVNYRLGVGQGSMSRLCAGREEHKVFMLFDVGC